MNYIFPSVKDRVENDQLNIACIQIQNLMDQLAGRQALEVKPFTWVFTDVNGKANEIAGDPVHRSPQDLRIYTALYTHPASAGVPDAMILDDEPNPESLESIARVESWNECRDFCLRLTAESQTPSLGQRKADQVGKTIGVLVQKPDGGVMAISDLGRCTMLRQDVTGAGDGVSVPTHQRVHEYDGAFECLDCGAQWGALPGNPKEPAQCVPAKGGDWIKCSDRLPEGGISVLVHYKSGNIYTSRAPVIEFDLNKVDGAHAISDRPTHWMPLPCPPIQGLGK